MPKGLQGMTRSLFPYALPDSASGGRVLVLKVCGGWVHLFLSSSVPAVVPGEQHGLHARAWLSLLVSLLPQNT